MSMTRCDECERLIDSDMDTKCYDVPDRCLCQWCREELEEPTGFSANGRDFTFYEVKPGAWTWRLEKGGFGHWNSIGFFDSYAEAAQDALRITQVLNVAANSAA